MAARHCPPTGSGSSGQSHLRAVRTEAQGHRDVQKGTLSCGFCEQPPKLSLSQGIKLLPVEVGFPQHCCSVIPRSEAGFQFSLENFVSSPVSLSLR